MGKRDAYKIGTIPLKRIIKKRVDKRNNLDYSDNTQYIQYGDEMNIIISNTGDTPIYEQIKEQIKNLIIDGRLKENEILPGMRTLAKDLKVSVITTKRAYNDLEQEGFIYSVPGRGSFVAGLNYEFLREDTLRKIEELFMEAWDLGKRIDLSPEEAVEILKNLWE